MANKKITELNEASSITSADWLVMVDTGNDETKKIHPDLVGASVPIQDTAPQNPETDDLWIDTSEPEELSAYIINNYSESASDTYSCSYTNKISNYSTNEQVIGKWIDDKPLYRKTYYISALGNATSVFQPLNINNLKEVVSIKGVASDNQNFFVLPSYRGSNDTAGIQITADINYGITITTGNDRTSYHAYVTLEYTKTTD